MKRLFTSILLLLLVVSALQSVQAQGYTRSNLLKINPLSLGLLTFNGSYERVISYNSSVQLGFYYTNASVFGTSWEGVGITPETRIYLFKSKPDARMAPEGFYVAPFARLQLLSIASGMLESGKEARASLSAISGGVTGGYQFLWGKEERFSLDLFIGPQLDNSKVICAGAAREEHFGGLSNFSGFSIRSGIGLGVAF